MEFGFEQDCSNGNSKITYENIDEMDIQYPDGDYGWIVVMCAATIAGLSSSVFKCSGQIYVSMLQDTNYTKSQLGIILVLPKVLSAISAVFSNKLCVMYSFRVTMFIGLFFVGLGLCLSSLLINGDINVFTSVYGVIIGIGIGFSLSPCAIITGLYFKKRRSYAIGVMVTLLGIISFTMPILLQWLLDEYHLQNALLLWGGILFQGCIAAMLLRQPIWALQKPNTNETDNFLENGNDQHNARNIYIFIKMIFIQLVHDCKHFQNITFILLLGNRFSYFFVSTCIYLILPQFALEQIGLTESQSAFLISTIAIADLVTSLISGCINNAFPNHKRILFLISIFCMALSALSFQFAYTYPTILATSLIFGLFLGYAYVAYVDVMFDTFGPNQVSGASAIQGTISGIFMLASGPIMVHIREITGSYRQCFTFIACLQALSVILWICKPIKKKLFGSVQ